MGGTVIGGGAGVTMVNAMDVQVVRGVNMPSSSTSTTTSSSSSSARLSSTNAAPIVGGGGGANTGGKIHCVLRALCRTHIALFPV